ncbi:GD16451 [Drosophila simulans]|uniref:GD16451 n=1 Tax=Drosophila simulans TaxID=7240 RepID=B4R2K1_DROSI|nr:GD16451 [Drosophila simulans]
MSDEVPLGRLSQIFDTLTNLQQQQHLRSQEQLHPQQHPHSQLQPEPQQSSAEIRRRSASSSPSPSASASASTSGRATPSLGVASPLNSLQYYSHAHNYLLRPQEVGGSGYLHTFPSHFYHHQVHKSTTCNSTASRPRCRPNWAWHVDHNHCRDLRFWPREPPPSVAKYHWLRDVSLPAELQQQSTVNPVLAALDAPDAPWPHFSTLTEHLDVHQVNNYGQALPQINWQERCLELQLELHRSKNQAGRIRDMLREKETLFS